MARRKRQEIKLKEDVTANVIPMVDIMFLLVLFFMLAADMTQKDLEIVELPYAETSINEKDKEAGESKLDLKRPTINVVHMLMGTCAAYSRRDICRDESHWAYKLKGTTFNYNLDNADPVPKPGEKKMEDLLRSIRVEWDNEAGRASDPASSAKPSEMPMMIRADRAAPFGYLQRVMGLAGKLFIYKVVVGASKDQEAPPK